jgi:hypothetical protein
MENTRGMGFQQFENLDATNRERNWAEAKKSLGMSRLSR